MMIIFSLYTPKQALSVFHVRLNSSGFVRTHIFMFSDDSKVFFSFVLFLRAELLCPGL